MRADQPSLAIDGPGRQCAPDPLVRRRQPADLPALFPACVAMFIEEVGYSPARAASPGSYEARVRGW